MNSGLLKQKFPKIYQQFFQKSQKVASAPHSFFWTGDFSGFYGGLTVSSKLPLRFYVGLEQIATDKLEIDPEVLAYSPAAKKFQKTTLDHYLISEIKKVLSTKLVGFKLHFLTEIALGTSVGGLGALSACLADLCKEKNEEIFPLAWQISQKLQRGRFSGATTFCALSQSPYPIVSYSKRAKFWGKPLDQIFPLKSSPVWPIDFGLIFSGNLVQGAAVIASAEEVKNVLEKREAEIKSVLKNDFENSFWQNYLMMLNQISGQNLVAFSDLFKKGSDVKTLQFFFNTLNQYQNLLHFLEISTERIDRIYSQIHRIANRNENGVGSGAKITGVGKGGEVLFAVPYGECRQKIKKYVQQENSGLSLDYTSWDDGFESEGLVLEQDLENKVCSPFLPADALLLTIYQKSYLSTTSITPLELKKFAPKIDLLLDTVTNKILLKSKSVHSSTLPSQKGGIEILRKLLKSPGKKLSNSKLPATYAGNRYDLQGKITSPLSRLVPLQFEITGGMYEDYSVTLKPFDIKIGILEKII